MLFNSLVEDHEKKISVEIDEMACRVLMMWIQSSQEFVGEVDFGEVDGDGIIEDVYNESEDDEVCEEIGKGMLKLYFAHPKYIFNMCGCVNPFGCQTEGCRLATLFFMLSLPLSLISCCQSILFLSH
jgi:hypothetical protein